MTGWFRAQLDEIAHSRALRLYGAVLAGTHAFTAWYWQAHLGAARTLSDRLSPVCWPWFPDCHTLRTALTAPRVVLVLFLYGLLSAASVALFLRTDQVRAAWFSLLALTLLKGALLVQDFRLWGNYHYMVFLVSVAYLALPRKRELIPLLIAAFYVAAGSLKLSPEWLSGAIMGRRTPFHLPTRLLEWGCAYVVLLELAIAPLLLARHRAYRYAALGQLAVFHVVSFYWVGAFYPVVMAALLAIFPLAWLEGEALYVFGDGWPARATLAALGAFAVAQVAPYLFAGDSALTGQGRWFALNMYDAHARCESLFVARMKDGTRVELAPHLDGVGPRAACDPYVYYEAARNACRRGARDPDFTDLDVSLVSRRTTDPKPHRLLAIDGFCGRNLRYALFRNNGWILP